MDCVAAAELLLDDESGQQPELEEHVASCARCAHMAQGLKRVDAVLRTRLVVEPPRELQARLSTLVVAMPLPAAPTPVQRPWWSRLPELMGQFDPAAWMARPQMVAAQGLAAVMLALASWQIFGWLTAFRPVVGDVAYAMTLVAASPAAVYLGGIQIDLQSLGLWSLVGLGGWLVSENGPIGSRIGSTRQQLP